MLFKNLELFLMIIEKGGLSAAGRELGLSPASVSDRLAMLEAHYGTTLFTRTTRSLRLTDEGQMLAEGARRLVSEAYELETSLKHSNQVISGPVRLSAPIDLGQACIVPIIDRFLEEHPQVTIELSLTDGFVDLVNQGFDFAIRYGELSDSRLRARMVTANRRLVCASAEYLQRYGTPRHPDDLMHHNCILMRFGTSLDNVWTFNLNGKPYKVSVHGSRVANNGGLVRKWCLKGYGLGLKSLWDVRDDLEAGRLIEVLPEYSTQQSPLQIVYPPVKSQPRRVRALMDAIVTGFEHLTNGDIPDSRLPPNISA